MVRASRLLPFAQMYRRDARTTPSLRSFSPSCPFAQFVGNNPRVTKPPAPLGVLLPEQLRPHGESGGGVAAAVARTALESCIEHGYLSP